MVSDLDMTRVVALLSMLLVLPASSMALVTFLQQRPLPRAQPVLRSRLVVLQDGPKPSTPAEPAMPEAAPQPAEADPAAPAAAPAEDGPAVVDFLKNPAGFTTKDVSAPEAALREKQIESVARASDPFRLVRTVLYAVFGLVSLAGAGIAVTKGNMADAGVNGAVFVGVGVAFLVDQKVQGALAEKAKEEIDNPYLKGEMLFADSVEEKDSKEKEM